MRVVGQYKNCDIRITGLYVSETYAGFLALSEKLYDQANRRIVNEDIAKSLERIWGKWSKDRVVCIIDLDKIVYNQLLPEVRVIVSLCCLEPIQEGHASDLYMAWFQEPDEDPFAKATSNLRKIVWEEKAKDFCF